MLGFDRKKTGEIPLVLGRLVRSYRFALAAFLVPVFIRSIPEILVGPYPIGWDTIAFYKKYKGSVDGDNSSFEIG
jgi:hypothetical protein